MSRFRYLRVLFFGGLAGWPASAALAAFPTVYLKPVALRQIHSPTHLVHAGDGSGRLFVCDQPGKIHIIQGGMLLPVPLLDISAASGGPAVPQTTGYSERGLLGLAFHPGFANPLSPGYRKFYLNYNKNYLAGSDPPPPVADHTPDCTTVIAEFQVSPTDPNIALPGSERRLLLFPQPQSNHNGGQMEFGPDGLLYIGSGDGGSSRDNNVGHTGGSAAQPTGGLGNAQDKTTLLGKILRIDPIDPDGPGPLPYTIPPGNPFFSDPLPGLKKEIYALGLRNPWKFSFDKRAGGTNRLFCGDVGQGRIEEINLITAGGNYGWRYLEGLELPSFSSGSLTNPMPHPGGTLTGPITMYAHPGVVTSPVLPQLGVSVTGGSVYRGAAIPAMTGKYVFGDYGASDGRLMGLEETAPGSGSFTLTPAIPLSGMANPVVGQHLLCLGEDEAGEIYLGMKSNSGVLQLEGGLPAGGIYQLVPLQNSSATLSADKDNTIFAEDLVLSRSFSDGRGYLYAGRTGASFGPYIRRGLVSFDVSSVPAGAVIQSAQLVLRLNKPGPSAAATTIGVHRLTETWGEGTSLNDIGGYGAPAATGDATWQRRFYNTSSWTTPGGSFAVAPSATATVSGTGLMTWASNPSLVGDVQGWLTTPAGNAGWIVRGDETINMSACRFDSVQLGGTPPALTLSYAAAPPASHFETWLAAYFPANQVGQYVDPNGDLDGDSIGNQIEYAYGFSPTAFNASNGFAIAVSSAAAGATDLTVTFRRDRLATDLTYNLQAGGNPSQWITIAQSEGGAAATGQNGGVVVSDLVMAGSIHLVTARLTLPAGSNHRQFVRLQVERR